MPLETKLSLQVECLRTQLISDQNNILTIPQLEELQCDHEEADTRIVLHTIQCDKPRTVIYGNDTDIIVGALCKTDQLGNKGVYEEV